MKHRKNRPTVAVWLSRTTSSLSLCEGPTDLRTEGHVSDANLPLCSRGSRCCAQDEKHTKSFLKSSAARATYLSICVRLFYFLCFFCPQFKCVCCASVWALGGCVDGTGVSHCVCVRACMCVSCAVRAKRFRCLSVETHSVVLQPGVICSPLRASEVKVQQCQGETGPSFHTHTRLLTHIHGIVLRGQRKVDDEWHIFNI